MSLPDSAAARREHGDLPDQIDGEIDELPFIVGRNLRRLRTRAGHTLERLAKLSGVSRAMLGQIELGRSVPSISILWKISRALEVPFAALTSSTASHGTVVLPKSRAKVLASSDATFTSRALFPFASERRVEFYELRLAPGGHEKAEAHAVGTVENLVVAEGEVEISTGGRFHALNAGDAIQFEADTPHSYRNTGRYEAVMYLVMTSVEAVG